LSIVTVPARGDDFVPSSAALVARRTKASLGDGFVPLVVGLASTGNEVVGPDRP
jgi:hypothetical protein